MSPQIKADKGLREPEPPIDWEALFQEVPRRFSKEEKYAANHWEKCILALFFPMISARCIARAELAQYERELKSISTNFSTYVKRDDWERAEECFNEMKNWGKQ